MAMRSHRSTTPLEPWRISCSSTWRFLEGRIGGSSWVSHHELPRIHMVSLCFFWFLSDVVFLLRTIPKIGFLRFWCHDHVFSKVQLCLLSSQQRRGSSTTQWEYSTHIPITSHHLGSLTLDDETLNFPILREIFAVKHGKGSHDLIIQWISHEKSKPSSRTIHLFWHNKPL